MELLVYLGPLGSDVDRVRLASISADVEQTMTTEETIVVVVVDGDDVVDDIIEDVLKDEMPYPSCAPAMPQSS